MPIGSAMGAVIGVSSALSSARLVRADEQPPVVEIKMADGIFIKQMAIAKAGTVIPQHSHVYDHTSMVAVGSVSVWCDGHHLGDYRAPTGILIPAHRKHLFVALEDGTVVYCIHRIDRTGEVEIAEEHHLPGIV